MIQISSYRYVIYVIIICFWLSQDARKKKKHSFDFCYCTGKKTFILSFTRCTYTSVDEKPRSCVFLRFNGFKSFMRRVFIIKYISVFTIAGIHFHYPVIANFWYEFSNLYIICDKYRTEQAS